ncbi:hypothetical protein PO883_11105 [Massilia sp. DJPM01]|uniref:hypothetical protein n=1 Tax=Massilia sp. DJPM01 TaxID=3024404 RepID=UPI00259F3A9B|nr:hypothetical protein [Massilia sp. DJPM01]MDM5177740.1 hypothetical protein [Massilia sp. DJPM01]
MKMHDREFPVIGPILVRHADDAAFYWSQLDSASRSYHWRFDDQIRTENLLAAHLDGLAIAGLPGFQHCVSMFDRWKKSGNLFTCVLLASKLGLTDPLDTLVERVQNQPDGMVRGLVSALLHLPEDQAIGLISKWSARPAKPVQKVAALRAIALRGAGSHSALACKLSAYFEDANTHIRAAACRAALTHEDHAVALDLLGIAMLDDDLQVRAEASIACLNTDLKAQAVAVLAACLLEQTAEFDKSSGWFRQQASRRLERWARYLAHVLPIGAPQLPDLLNLLPTRIALTMVLAHGDLAYLPFALDKIRDPSVSRYAGWVWQTLTGMELARMGWTVSDDDSVSLAPSGPVTQARLDADNGLPEPNHAALAAYMATQPFSRLRGVRVLLGQQRDLASALALLKDAPQCIRALAAHTLNLSQSWLIFNVRASTAEQIIAMDALDEIISRGTEK